MVPPILSKHTRASAAPALPALRALVLFGAIVLTSVQAQAASGGNAHGGAVPPPSRSAALDGLSFVGPTGMQGRSAHHDDRIVFSNGRFTSIECERLGFGQAQYRAEYDGEAIRFEAVSHSDRHGTLHWQGTARGGRVEASYVWTRERLLWTTRIGYWFAGVRAEAGR